MISLTAVRTLTLAVLGASLSLGVGTIAQAFTVYTDRAAFNAATAGLTTLDFEGIAPSGSYQYTPSPPGYSAGGATFTDTLRSSTFPSSAQYIISKTYVDPFGNSAGFFGSDFLSENYTNSAANITFANPVTAFGTDIAGISLDNTAFTFTLPTGNYVFQPGLGKIGFIGFTFSNPIASLLITPEAGHRGPQLDNVSFGQASAVPTPALLPGLLGMGFGLWRRYRRTTAADQTDK